MSTEQNKSSNKLIITLLITAYLILLLITAWLSDDTYITFRSVDNFINGYGLTWNIGERVQAYTHPLWILTLSVFYFFSRELYFTTIFLSISISLFAFYILVKNISVTVNNSIIAGLILIFSKAFVDYSTSGLENPLSHLTILLFFTVYFSSFSERKKIFTLSLITSLAALSRLDILIILLPALGFIYLNKREKTKSVSLFLAGFIPLFAWELFSLFYYGFPFPNTAYAKLNTGIERVDLIRQGLFYMLDSFYIDPLTFFTLVAGILVGALKRKNELKPIAIGITLYIIYTISIGGDFMSGRFFTAPLLCSVIIFSKTEIKSLKFVLIYSTLIVGLGFLSPRPTVLSTSYYSLGPKIINAFRFGPTITGINEGITDERFWYYENTGLLNNLHQDKVKKHPWVQHVLMINRDKDKLVAKATVGLFGYYAGRDVHIVDQYGLTEPLLARITPTEYWLIGKVKPKNETFWRIGHFARKIPEGYLETLKTGKNKIINKSLAKYCEKLAVLVRGDLWNWNRIKEIWNFNTGQYDYLIKDYNKALTSNQ